MQILEFLCPEPTFFSDQFTSQLSSQKKGQISCYNRLWRRGEGQERYSSTLSLTSALHWSGWLAPLSCRSTSGKRPVSNWKGAGPVRRGTENLTSTGVRKLDRPSCSESLLRLRYSDRPLSCFTKYSTYRLPSAWRGRSKPLLGVAKWRRAFSKTFAMLAVRS